MRILVKKSFVEFEGLKSFQMNKEYDVPDKDANYYILKGYAISLEQEKKVVKKTTKKKSSKVGE